MSMANDYKKHNEAVRCGWSILYFMGHQLQDETLPQTIKYIIGTINLRSHVQRPPSLPKDEPPPTPSVKELFAELRRKHDESR